MTLYGSRNFGTLTPGVAAAHCAIVARGLERVARAVRDVLQPRRTARRLLALSVRAAQRQSPQVASRNWSQLGGRLRPGFRGGTATCGVPRNTVNVDEMPSAYGSSSDATCGAAWRCRRIPRRR